jgi:hypothetical protein
MKVLYVEDNDDKAFAEKPALARRDFLQKGLDPGWQH